MRTLARWLGRLVTVTLSIAVGLGLFEVALRALGYTPIFGVYSKPSLFWRFDSLTGWSHEPGSEGRYVGPRPWPIEFDASVRINAHGLRGPEIAPKAPDTIRVMVLGDSQVVAFEVEEEETFVRLTEARLRRRTGSNIELINAAVRGYGTDQSLLYFRERGFKLEPDVVVLIHSANDLRNNVTLHRMARPFGKSAFRPRPDGGLEQVGHPVPRYPICSAVGLGDDFQVARLDTWSERAFCFLETRLSESSALFAFLAARLQQHPDVVHSLHRLIGSGPRPLQRGLLATARIASVLPLADLPHSEALAGAEARIRLTEALVVDLHREVTSHDMTFLFVLGTRQARRLDRFGLERAGVSVAVAKGRSLLPADKLQFVKDGHYNVHGHRLWANILTDILEPIVRHEMSERGLEPSS